jgi:pilus assembly protein CpaB
MLRAGCVVLRRMFGRERARGQWVRNWRVLTAIAAVVLAALAGVLVWKYTDDAKQDAKKPFKFVTVLVASKNVSANTSFATALKSKLIERTDRVRDSVPESYINGTLTDQALSKTFGERIASHDLVAGQTIVASDFSAQGALAASGLSGQLATDEDKVGKNNAQAITLNLDDVHAVGGFLTPGDHVNVIVSVDHKGILPDGNKVVDDQIQGVVKTTAFLLPGMKVLAVGNTTAATQAAEADGSTPTTVASIQHGMITLEATPRQALQLAHATEIGRIYLSLMPSTFKAGDFKDVEEIAEAANFWDQGLPLTDKLLRELGDVTK